MPEIRVSFSDRDEYSSWLETHGPMDVYRSSVLADVRAHGYIEPFTGIRRLPHEIDINESSLHESISSHELNSRKRALLAQLYIELHIRGWATRRNLRILAAEGVTRSALILRGRFPYFHGGEYLPDAEAKQTYFPIPHLDLMSIDLPDASFDVFISGDVFEHIPDLNKALHEIVRVLKPGGLLISSFPFNPKQIATQVRARIGADGAVEHIEPAEYHGNPVDPSGGSLVFSYPGWDILKELQGMGCADARYAFLASSQHGVTSDRSFGVPVLVAEKAGEKAPVRPPNLFSAQSLPDRFCLLLGLPRSGTTLLTSMFAVHRNFSTVYEPFNGGVLKQGDELTLPALAKAEGLPSLTGRSLLVKETAARPAFINMARKLTEQTPYPVSKKIMAIIREPRSTYRSEIIRRKQWWSDTVTISQESFDAWCEKTRGTLKTLLNMIIARDGRIVCLENLASDPQTVLEALCSFLDVDFDPRQLEYERHLNVAQVRGDLNISQSPKAVAPELTTSSDEQLAQIDKLANASQHSAWFRAFIEFHQSARSAPLITLNRATAERFAPLFE